MFMRFLKKRLRKWRDRSKTLQEVFSSIYHRQQWKTGISLSGSGSELAQTSAIRLALPALLKEINAQTFLDASCGDHHWMSQVKLELAECTGVDVVSNLIVQNQAKYGNTNWKFIQRDITKDLLPRSDLILCRDCLVHLSYQQILAALKNFKASGSQYVLLTTFPGCLKNKDIATGGWRPLNFLLPPFHFPEPMKLVNENNSRENGKHSSKSLGLWKLSDVPV